MTLFDWFKNNPNVKPLKYGQSLSVVVYERDVKREEYRKLWHLEDYAVSSIVSGPAVILSLRSIPMR